MCLREIVQKKKMPELQINHLRNLEVSLESVDIKVMCWRVLCTSPASLLLSDGFSCGILWEYFMMYSIFLTEVSGLFSVRITSKYN